MCGMESIKYVFYYLVTGVLFSNKPRIINFTLRATYRYTFYFICTKCPKDSCLDRVWATRSHKKLES